MSPQNDFVSVIRDNVQAYGNKPSFTFVTEERGPGRTYHEDVHGFADLDRAARAMASRLQALGLRDRAVLLLYPEGLEFLTAFLGCLYARVIAVPAPLPELDAGRSGRTLRIIEDADVACILTDGQHHGPLMAWLEEAGLRGRVSCLTTDIEADADPGDWTMPHIDEDTLAFLQYTSGSTSDPKGVMVTHGNLLANEEEIRRRIDGSADTFGVGWVPHYHDMGLVGQILQPLYCGFSYVLTSPITFIKRPVLWLELITKHRATIAVAPNFGYDLCLRRVTDQQMEGLDLSCLRTAKNGAEPVRAGTLERMVERFGPVGFRPNAWMPCYGMAEATLLISAAPVDHGAVIRDFDEEALSHHAALGRSPSLTPSIPAGPPSSGEGVPPTPIGASAVPSDGGGVVGTDGSGVRRLVSSGRSITLDVRVVEPETRVELPDGKVGEIWVGGPSVAKGYWGRPEQTREIFQAVTAEGAGPFLRTGDLGFLVDGELYVTGRIKDLIIVNGRNIYAHDIEEVSQSAHPAALTAAAFSVDTGADPATEQVIVVQEVRAAAAGGMPLPELAALTRDTVARTFGLPALSVVLCRRGAVRRTTSGKIQRQATRNAFLTGEIIQLAGDLDPALAGLGAARE